MLACLTSQQHTSVSQGRICSDNFTCCHTELEVADQTLRLIQSQYTDTGPTSSSTDLITPGAWQDSHWSAKFFSYWYDSTRKRDWKSRIFLSRGGRLNHEANEAACWWREGGGRGNHPSDIHTGTLLGGGGGRRGRGRWREGRRG